LHATLQCKPLCIGFSKADDWSCGLNATFKIHQAWRIKRKNLHPKLTRFQYFSSGDLSFSIFLAPYKRNGLCLSPKGITMNKDSSKTDFDESAQNTGDPSDKLSRGWKESAFVIFIGFDGFFSDEEQTIYEPEIFMFEHRMINPTYPQIPNHTLNEDGFLMKDVYLDFEQLQARISNITGFGGIPDESMKAIATYRQAVAEHDASPPAWASLPDELTP